MASSKSTGAPLRKDGEKTPGISIPAEREISERGLMVHTPGPDAKYLEELASMCNSPGFKAWHRVTVLLREAQKDPIIQSSAAAIEFLAGMARLTGHAMNQDNLDAVMKPLYSAVNSEKAREARNKRTSSGSEKVKQKALELYDEKKRTKNSEAAAEIFPELQKFANSLTPKQSVSKDRFEKTLGGWLLERKRTANS